MERSCIHCTRSNYDIRRVVGVERRVLSQKGVDQNRVLRDRKISVVLAGGRVAERTDDGAAQRVGVVDEGRRRGGRRARRDAGGGHRGWKKKVELEVAERETHRVAVATVRGRGRTL